MSSSRRLSYRAQARLYVQNFRDRATEDCLDYRQYGSYIALPDEAKLIVDSIMRNDLAVPPDEAKY